MGCRECFLFPVHLTLPQMQHLHVRQLQPLLFSEIERPKLFNHFPADFVAGRSGNRARPSRTRGNGFCLLFSDQPWNGVLVIGIRNVEGRDLIGRTDSLVDLNIGVDGGSFSERSAVGIVELFPLRGMAQNPPKIDGHLALVPVVLILGRGKPENIGVVRPASPGSRAFLVNFDKPSDFTVDVAPFGSELVPGSVGAVLVHRREELLLDTIPHRILRLLRTFKKEKTVKGIMAALSNMYEKPSAPNKRLPVQWGLMDSLSSRFVISFLARMSEERVLGSHLVNCYMLAENLVIGDFGKVRLADDRPLDVTGMGDMVLQAPVDFWTLKDVTMITALKKKFNFCQAVGRTRTRGEVQRWVVEGCKGKSCHGSWKKERFTVYGRVTI
ncbi:unnamed protein product [Cuscuta campestris]|uniref:Uncharacterized protein n=1 Tax=Cuscuta campestris TaxID=132261 RepID=A0A484KS42_9ASTE|nr:unnamed protein product [Cuscuta campestris]